MDDELPPDRPPHPTRENQTPADPTHDNPARKFSVHDNETPADPAHDNPARDNQDHQTSARGVPARERDTPRAPRPRLATLFGGGVTAAAIVVAATAAAAVLAALAGLLTLFGWGLAIAVALAAVTIAAALRPRPANAWLLVPVLALAVPAVAVAVSGVRVMPQRDTVTEAPTASDQIPKDGYRSGLGDLVVDLRGLRANPGESITVRAGSDLGRTVVALPQDRCFALDVRWSTGGLRLPRVHEQPTVQGFRPRGRLDHMGRQGPRHRKRYGLVDGRIALFGRAYAADQGRWVAEPARSDVPKLTLELQSEGGSFVVRDYPSHVSPLRSALWPIDQPPPPHPIAVPVDARLRDVMQRQQRAVQRMTQQLDPDPAATSPTTRGATSTTTREAAPTEARRATSTTVRGVPSPGTSTTAQEATPTEARRATSTTTRTAPRPGTSTTARDATSTEARDATTEAPRATAVRSTGPVRPTALAALRLPHPGSAIAIDRRGNVLATDTRQADRWRRAVKRRQAFGRTWAARVAGNCQPPGSLR